MLFNNERFYKTSPKGSVRLLKCKMIFKLKNKPLFETVFKEVQGLTEIIKFTICHLKEYSFWEQIDFTHCQVDILPGFGRLGFLI